MGTGWHDVEHWFQDANGMRDFDPRFFSHSNHKGVRMARRSSHRMAAEALLPDKTPTRNWYVKDASGGEHVICAHYCFDNGEDGLLFRRYINDDRNNRTEVVVHFAKGFWQFYKETV